MGQIMKNMTLENIAIACGGELFGEDKKSCISMVSIDSRKIEKDSLFIAIPGKRVDGHDFISDVFQKGAICCISERILEKPLGAYIKVASSLEAIKKIAVFYREQFSITVIGITGSVGKTSTKELIASVLSQKFCVLKTDGNFNNELGLPLTVFRIRKEHQIAVLEMGISDFGEMYKLSEIAKPDLALITNIGECHLEKLGDRDGVLKAKTEIFDFLAKDGSILVNGDDDKLAQIKQVGNHTILHFGLENSCEIYADQIENNGLEGSVCKIHFEGDAFFVHIPIPGIHMVRNALAAAAVGRVFHMTVEEIKKGIETWKPVYGRMNKIERNGKTILDDSYNANPVSMKAGLDVLKSCKGRCVAILGDMGELGDKEKELHQEIGSYCAKLGIDVLLCSGNCSYYMAEAAIQENSKIEVHFFEKKLELIAALPEFLRQGDTILVKASRRMGYEEVVAAI